MASYPSTLLPAPRIAGYGIDPTDMTARTEMDAGNVVARRRTYHQRDVVNVAWTFSDRQMAIFRAWFHSSEGANGGAGWFDMVLLDGWHGKESRNCRFASNWQAKYVPHLYWEVTATIEMRNVVYTARQLENLMLGIMEQDVVLLWAPTTQADVLVSKIGPDAEMTLAGAQYDESGTSLGTAAALHSKGVWVGPEYSSLFTGPVEAQTKTLTAQKYTVWCDSGSVVCGSYGTATASAPLTFTATAGDCTFTPSGVTRWMLTATVAPMPYVPPGTSVASAAGSTTNGLSWEMSAEMTAALSGACTVAVLATVGVSDDDMTNGQYQVFASAKDTGGTQNSLFYGKNSGGVGLLAQSYDGSIFTDGVAKTFDRSVIVLAVVETDEGATFFRAGAKRVGVDSAMSWSNWKTYDGDLDHAATLRAAIGATLPLWLKAVMVSKLGGLTDAQIEARIYA